MARETPPATLDSATMTPKRNAKPKAAKAKMGRPSPYRPEYARMAFRHALLGAKDSELGLLFAVSEQTINAWKKAHPEFLESLRKGKCQADSAVADSLYQSAKGYKHKAVKIFAKPDTGDVVKVDYIERYPPNATSAIFWLKNRQPDLWRDKTEVSIAPSKILSLPPDELLAVARGGK